MGSRKLIKIGMFIVALFAGATMYLAVQLATKQVPAVNAQTNCESCTRYEKSKADYEYWKRVVAPGKTDPNWEKQIQDLERQCNACKNPSGGVFKCGDNVCPAGFNSCNPLDRNECLRPDDPRHGAKCRYQSKGGTCAPAKFADGLAQQKLTQPNQMLFCNGGNIVYKGGGYTYMSDVTVGTPRCFSGADKGCNEPNRTGIVPGNGTTCGNPYRCAEQPTPQPAPKAKIRIKAVCDGSINLTGIDFAVSRGGKVLATGKTEQEATVEGLDRVDIYLGKLPESITNTYKNINPKGERSLQGKNVDSNNVIEYRFDYIGCAAPTTTPVATSTPAPTKTPEPTKVPVRNPKIVISKTVIGNNTPAAQGKIKFNITVRNIGDTDITSFALSDDFAPFDKDGYLRFDSVSYKTAKAESNCAKPGEGICPKVENLSNGRKKLLWDNMPPKSGVASEDGILNRGSADKSYQDGEELVLTLEFTLVKTFAGDPGELNDNCGTVHTITYRDENNKDSKTDVNSRSCTEFFSPKPSNLTVDITKDYLGGIVNVGKDVTFKAVIRNTSDRAYEDIDFTDEYNLNDQRVAIAKALRLKTVFVAKGNRSVEVKNYSSRDPLKIDDLQNIEYNGVKFGNLEKGETMELTLVYSAEMPFDKVCDVVTVNVTDKDKNRATDNALACSDKIVAPEAPVTGANFILNFIAPMLALGATIAGKFIINRA